MIFSLAYLSQLYGENCMHAQSNIYDFSIVGLQPLHYLHDFLHDITQIILHKEPYTVTQFFFFYWFYFYNCYTNHFNVVRKADSSEKMN